MATTAFWDRSDEKLEIPVSRSTHALYGALTGTIQHGLQVASQVLVVPFVLAIAGKEALGAYAALIQLVSYLGFVDLGFGAAASWYLASAFGQPDAGQQFRSLMATCRIVMLVINTAFAVLLLASAFHLPLLLSLSGHSEIEARNGMLLLASWALLKTPFALDSMALRSTQQLGKANVIATVGSAVRLIALYALVKTGAGVFALIAGNVIGEAVTTIIQSVAFRRQNPGLRPSQAEGFRVVREMFGFAAFAVVANSGLVLINGTDNLVVSKLFGPAAAAVYYSTYAPAQVLWQTLFRIPGNVAPGLAELNASGGRDGVIRAYPRLLRYGMVASVFASICFMGLHYTVIVLWVGSDNYGGRLMTVSLAVVLLFATPNTVCGTILTAIGAVRLVALCAIGEGCLNLVASIYLGRRLGIQGVALGTALGAVASCPAYLYFLNRSLGLSLRELGATCLKPFIYPALLTVPLMLLMAATDVGATLFNFFLTVLVGSVWLCLCFATVVSADDRARLFSFLRRRGLPFEALRT